MGVENLDHIWVLL